MQLVTIFLITTAMLVLKNMLSPMIIYELYGIIGAIYIYLNKRENAKLNAGKSCVIGISGGIVVFLFGFLITLLMSLIFGGETAEVQKADVLKAVIMTGVIPAVCEELFFRGMLQTGLERMTDSRKTIIITSLIFAVFHLPPIKIPAMLIAGAVFGFVYNKTGRLSAAMLAHAVNNCIAVVVMNV